MKHYVTDDGIVIATHRDDQSVSYPGTSAVWTPDDVQPVVDGNDEARLPEMALSVWITIKRREADAILAEKLAQGGQFEGILFDIDDQSQVRLNSALSVAETMTLGGQTWPGVNWTAADNTLFQIPDIATLRDMVISLGAQGAVLFAIWQGHKQAVSAMFNIVDVQNYDLQAGWP